LTMNMSFSKHFGDEIQIGWCRDKAQNLCVWVLFGWNFGQETGYLDQGLWVFLSPSRQMSRLIGNFYFHILPNS
jgi:hypothetical protein